MDRAAWRSGERMAIATGWPVVRRLVSSPAVRRQRAQDLVAGFGGQPSQHGDIGRLRGWKARRGGRFTGLVDEAVEACSWGADQQESGRRLTLDAEAVRDFPGPKA